jgi:hypothetical protein
MLSVFARDPRLRNENLYILDYALIAPWKSIRKHAGGALATGFIQHVHIRATLSLQIEGNSRIYALIGDFSRHKRAASNAHYLSPLVRFQRVFVAELSILLAECEFPRLNMGKDLASFVGRKVIRAFLYYHAAACVLNDPR